MNQVSMINAQMLSNAGNSQLAASNASANSDIFANLFQSASFKSQQISYSNSVSDAQTSDAQNAYDVSFKQTDIKEAVTDDVNPVKDELVNAVSEITEAIKDELGVSDDEITEALETLGLTYMDLFTANGLTQVVQHLTGVSDVSELLINTDFTNILSAQTETLSELSQMTLDLIANYDVFANGSEQLPQQIVTEMQSIIADVASMTLSISGETSDIVNEFAGAEISEEADSFENVIAEDSTLSEGTEFTSDANTFVGQATSSLLKNNADSAALAETLDAETASQDTDADFELSTEAKAAMITDESDEQANAFTQGDNESSMSDNSEGSELDRLSELFKDSSDGANTQVFTTQTSTAQTITGQEMQTVTTTTYIDPEIAQSMISQVSEQVVLQVADDAQTMVLQLNPENLGKLLVSVTTKQGEVSAQLAAENDAVKAALESQVNILKETLAAQGLKVTEVEVTVADHELEENLEKNQQTGFNQEMSEHQGKDGREEGRRNIMRGELDSLSGLMTEEEALIARIMSENGNTMDLTA